MPIRRPRPPFRLGPEGAPAPAAPGGPMSTIPCPACGRFLPEAPTACPGCDLPLTGPDAARLWQVDQSLAALQRERVSLIASLRATVTTPAVLTAPSPAATASDAGSAPGTTTPAAPPTPVAAPRRSWTTQQTLLAVGVLLVLVAASIALAIAWFIIGRYGQMVVMGALTALAAWSSL